MSEKNKKAKGICLAKLSNEERCYPFCLENGTVKQSAFLVEWGASLERVFCLVLGVNHWSKISHELRSRKLFLECLNGIKNLVATADLHSPSFGAVINPFTPKISIAILLTVCHTILVVLLKPIHLDAEESDYPEPREFQAYKTHLKHTYRLLQGGMIHFIYTKRELTKHQCKLVKTSLLLSRMFQPEKLNCRGEKSNLSRKTRKQWRARLW